MISGARAIWPDLPVILMSGDLARADLGGRLEQPGW